MMPIIRRSTLEDLPRLMEIYREGREIMLSCGNLNQWKPGYPTEDIVRNLRIDTHEDNVIMRHCIAKAGFHYCGVIHLLNGSPRLAYQKV